MNEIALAILSYRRHEMLTLQMQTLVANEGLGDVDIYLFQDSAIGPSGKALVPEEEIEESVKVFTEAGLPRSFVYRQKQNRGLIGQTVTAFSTLFDKGYKFVMLVPNDALLGPYYVKTLQTIHRQFYDDKKLGVFMTMTARERQREVEDSIANQDKVAYGPSPISGTRLDHGLWDYCWKVVGSRAQGFLEDVSKHDYLELLAARRGEGTKKAKATATRLANKYGTLDADSFIVTLARLNGFLCLHTATPRACHWGVGSLRPDFLAAKREKWKKYPELLNLERIIRYENGPVLWPAGNVDSYEVVGDRADREWEGESAPPPQWVKMAIPNKKLPKQLTASGDLLYPIRGGKYVTVHADDRELFIGKGFKEVQIVYGAADINRS